MKKVISICLAAVFVLLAFAGCSKGGETKTETETKAETETTKQAAATKEDLLAKAIEADAYEINNVAYKNLVAAKEKYCNKVLKLTGKIKKINEDNVVLCGTNSSTYRVAVYLPTKEMVELQSGQQITVVGEMNDKTEDSTMTYDGYTFEFHDFQIPNAFLVQDTFEIEGTLSGESKEYAPAFEIKVGKKSKSNYVFFADSVDTSSFSHGQKIKFKAKCVNQGVWDDKDRWVYYDAEIIE